jgi:hypothetical protein
LEAGVGKIGVFDIQVRQVGYADWQMSNVLVDSNGCHPNTVEVTALLRR